MIKYIDIIRDNNNFYLKVPKLSEKTKTALESALYTVDYIIQNYPAPYTLCVSGGVDSQAMLYSWVLSEKPFNTFSAVYNNNFNEHDLETLDLFSKNLGIKINYVPVDILKFLFEEFEGYANTYRCGSPHICTFMKFANLIDKGTVIFGGNFRRNNLTNPFPVDTNNFGIYKFGLISQRSIVPWFFLETYEIYNNFVIENFNYESRDPKIPYRIKYETYQKNSFPVIPQNQKYTGFEKIKEHFDNHYSHLVTETDKLVSNINQPSKRTFDFLFRNKYEVKFNQDLYVVGEK